MPRFDKLAAASAGEGLQYYSSQNFSFTKTGGVFLAYFTGSYNHTNSTFTLPLNKPLTGSVFLNILVNIDKNGYDQTFGPGEYKLLLGSIADSVQTGISGGFPVFYRYTLNATTDANNLIFNLDVGNPSGVNDVTTQDITFSGKVFFYLAPF